MRANEATGASTMTWPLEPTACRIAERATPARRCPGDTQICCNTGMASGTASSRPAAEMGGPLKWTAFARALPITRKPDVLVPVASSTQIAKAAVSLHHLAAARAGHSDLNSATILATSSRNPQSAASTSEPAARPTHKPSGTPSTSLKDTCEHRGVLPMLLCFGPGVQRPGGAKGVSSGRDTLIPELGCVGAAPSSSASAVPRL
eukprot:CAMPEP_0170435546 /NCGR_PEP_ID=MMETSP0117_2-20130122/43662_1 /TAXON_ID=400756 /ORGANISM="Durinskia baltica, Strain CSIRO CS-38" /LENGTH=204 /DNA_ID=CAMNT_0010695515 /DNA_START=90 /DNA_END=701 /DNA_ORIENTATION=-